MTSKTKTTYALREWARAAGAEHNRPEATGTYHVSDKTLRDLYEVFNRTIFEGKLPPLTDEFVCEFAELPGALEGLCTDTHHAEEVFRASNIRIPKGIRIAQGLRRFPYATALTLFHECVHMSAGEDPATGKLLVGFHGDIYRNALQARNEMLLNWMTGDGQFTVPLTEGRG